MDIKIEKGIPIPHKNSRLGSSLTRKREDVLLSMEVGDSFLYPLDKDNLKKSYGVAYNGFKNALNRLKGRKQLPATHGIKGAADSDGFHIRIWLIDKTQKP